MHSFIELFAGCGGLSLGLRSEGFNELLANELSPMPAETFALNLLGADLRSEVFSATDPSSRPVLWLDPSSDDIVERLSANPYEAPQTDMHEVADCKNLTGKFIIGDIRRLNSFIGSRKNPLIHGEVDLVSGGPPCQSFSLAGRREFGNQRNQLPWEFAKFVNVQKPRVALLENVEGILRPFKLENRKYYAWFEVCKAFASIGYVTLPLLINARLTGVAQNRPRFIMLAVREDLVGRLSEQTAVWFEQGKRLIAAQKQGDTDYDPKKWVCHDLTDKEIDDARDSFLKPLVAFSDTTKQRTVLDAIGDLQDDDPLPQSKYVEEINRVLGPVLADPKRPVANLHHPNSTPRVRARFRVYQIMASSSPAVADNVKAILKEESHQLSDETIRTLAKSDLLEYSGPIDRSGEGLLEYLTGLHTKKFSQKALHKDQPAPAALSIPDDICHYSEARTLSVREMARIQSFPDAFEFRGIATTGGLRRRYQVPQYTQIGNAVPPLMGRALGKVANSLLDELG